MDMPEGLLLLEAAYMDLGVDDQGDSKVLEAMDLMREMAEALEFVSSSSNCCEYRDNCDAIKNVLKKFKEWK